MELKDIGRIGVIGAGLMGHGIAQVFASAGYDVNLYDADKATLEAAKGKIEANFKPFIALGLAKPEDVSRLSRTASPSVLPSRHCARAPSTSSRPSWRISI